VDWEPLVALLPAHPPEAVQALAFLADQLSVAAAPFDTVLGLAPMVTMGAAEPTDTVADWEALPPRPVHVKT
jgi:hypothetical protein